MTEATQQTPDVCPKCGAAPATEDNVLMKFLCEDGVFIVWKCLSSWNEGKFDQSHECEVRALRTQLAAAVERAEKAEEMLAMQPIRQQ